MQDVDGTAQGEVEADIAEETTFDPDGYRAELDAPDDAVGTRLLLANDRLRVWEIRLEPGERAPFHRHVMPISGAAWTRAPAGSASRTGR
jgi:beta-alanine degradation protein BauB